MRGESYDKDNFLQSLPLQAYSLMNETIFIIIVNTHYYAAPVVDQYFSLAPCGLHRTPLWTFVVVFVVNGVPLFLRISLRRSTR